MPGNIDPIASARVLRSELAPHWGRMGSFQWGKVAAIHPGTPPTVDVYLDGSTSLTLGIYYMATYIPTVNDIVVVGRMQGPAQTARFVIGPLATNITASLPQKIDEAIGADFPAAIVVFPFHGAAFPSSGHLEIFYDLRDTNTGSGLFGLQIQFNGDTSANYGYGQLYNSSTTVASYAESVAQTSATIGLVVAGGSTAGWSARGRILIPNFAGATIKQASGVVAGAWGSGGGGTATRTDDITWNSTAAITSIKLFSNSGNSFASNSVISLYRWP